MNLEMPPAVIRFMQVLLGIEHPPPQKIDPNGADRMIQDWFMASTTASEHGAALLMSIEKQMSDAWSLFWIVFLTTQFTKADFEPKTGDVIEWTGENIAEAHPWLVQAVLEYRRKISASYKKAPE